MVVDGSNLTIKEVNQKLEYLCSYQERCHADVSSKLFDFRLTQDEKDGVIVHLIQNNFLNEERFALLFAIFNEGEKYDDEIECEKRGKRQIGMHGKGNLFKLFREGSTTLAYSNPRTNQEPNRIRHSSWPASKVPPTKDT